MSSPTETKQISSELPQTAPSEGVDVNYDNGPTVLYDLIQQRKWDDVVERSKSHRAEAWTWIYRMEKDSQVLRWRILPIHAALLFKCETAAINALLEAYPDCVGKEDDQGMLPLHLAFRNYSSEDIINQLISSYPEGLKYEDKKGRVPTDFLAVKDDAGGYMRQHLALLLKKSGKEVAGIEKEKEKLKHELDKTTNIIKAYSDGLQDLESGSNSKDQIAKVSKTIEDMMNLPPMISLQSLREKALLAEVELLRSKNKELEEALSSANANAESQTEKSKEDEEEYEELCQKIKELEENTEVVVKEREVLKKELQSAKNIHNEDVQDLSQQLSAMSQKNETNMHRMEKLILLVNVLQTQLDDLPEGDANDDDDLGETIESKIEKAELLLDRVSQALVSGKDFLEKQKGLEEEFSQNVEESKETENLRNENKEISKENSMLRGKNEELSESVKKLSVDINLLETTIESLEKMVNEKDKLYGSEKASMLDSLDALKAEFTSSKDTVSKQADVIDQLKKTIDEGSIKFNELTLAKEDIVSNNRRIPSDESKPLASMLDFSKVQMEELMRVNKSYEDGALKSAERYKVLKDLYDGALVKLKFTTDSLDDLRSEVESHKKKNDDLIRTIERLETKMHDQYDKIEEMKRKNEAISRGAELMKNDMSAKFEEEREAYRKERELILAEKAECEESIKDYQEKLETEENLRVQVMEQLEMIEQEVKEENMRQQEEGDGMVEAIADMTVSNAAIERELGQAKEARDKAQSRLVMVEADLKKSHRELEDMTFKCDGLLEKIMLQDGQIKDLEAQFLAVDKENSLLRDELEDVEQKISMESRDKSSVEQKSKETISALTLMNDELEHEMRKVKAISSAHIADIEEEKEGLKTQLLSVEEDLAIKTKEMDEIMKEFTKYQVSHERVDTLEFRLHQKEKENDKMKKDLQHIELMVQEEQKRRSDEKKEYQSIVNQLTSTNEKMKQEIEHIRLENAEHIVDIERDRDSSNRRLAVIEEELIDKTKQVDSLVRQVEVLEDDTRKLHRVEEELHFVRDQNASNEETQGDLIGKISALKKDLQNYKDLLGAGETEKTVMKEELAELEAIVIKETRARSSEKEKSLETIYNLTLLNDNLENEVKRLKNEISDHICHIDEEKEKMNEVTLLLEDKISTKQDEVEILIEELEKKTEEYQDLEAELSKMKEAYMRDNDTFNTDMDEFEKKMEQLMEENENYDKEVKNLESSLRYERKQRESLSNQILQIEKAVVEEERRHTMEIENYQDMVSVLEDQKRELKNAIATLT